MTRLPNYKNGPLTYIICKLPAIYTRHFYLNTKDCYNAEQQATCVPDPVGLYYKPCNSGFINGDPWVCVPVCPATNWNESLDKQTCSSLTFTL